MLYIVKHPYAQQNPEGGKGGESRKKQNLKSNQNMEERDRKEHLYIVSKFESRIDLH